MRELKSGLYSKVVSISSWSLTKVRLYIIECLFVRARTSVEHHLRAWLWEGGCNWVNPLKTYGNLVLKFFSVLEFLLDVILYSDITLQEHFRHVTDWLRSLTRKSNMTQNDFGRFWWNHSIGQNCVLLILNYGHPCEKTSWAYAGMSWRRSLDSFQSRSCSRSQSLG